MRIISFLVLGIFLQQGCIFQRNEKLNISEIGGKKITIDSSLTVSLMTMKQINNIFSYLSKEGNDFLAAQTGDSVTVFAMNSGIEIRTIAIPKVMMEDSVGETSLKSICLNDTNDIFLISRKLIVRNDEGNVSTREINFKREEYLLYNLQNDHPVFDEQTGELYLQKYSTKYPQNEVGFYTTPVLSSLNWNTGKETDIKIIYPENYLKNYYGFANHVYFSSNKLRTVVSFTASPDFVVYNRMQDKLDFVKGRSRHQKHEADKLPREALQSRREKMQHWYSIPEYHETLIDGENKFIYRFYLNGQDLKKVDGTYNSYWDKSFYLMVFDEQYNLLDEFDLTNRGYNLFFSFPGSNKLYLMQKTTEKRPTFRVFKFIEQ